MDATERKERRGADAPPGSFWENTLQTAIQSLRSAAPKLVPVMICIAAIPFLVTLSFAAGWTVYSGVAVGQMTPLYLQYGEGRPPYANTRLPNLSPNTPYDVSVILTVPNNAHNVDLGNFMVTLHLTNARNATITQIRRSSIILEPSPIFVLFGPPRKLSELSIPLLSSFLPPDATLNAIVELGRSDNWQSIGSGESKELNVFSAHLRAEVRPRGLRFLLSRFPISTAAAASASFFTLSLMTLITCLVPLTRSGASDDNEDEALLHEEHLGRRPVKQEPSSTRVTDIPHIPQQPVPVKSEET